jgi:hypothetical protein
MKYAASYLELATDEFCVGTVVTPLVYILRSSYSLQGRPERRGVRVDVYVLSNDT